MRIITEYDFFKKDEDFKKYFKSLEEKKIEEITKDEYIKLFCYIDEGERINSERNENYSDFVFRENWFENPIFINLSKIFFDEFITQVILLIDKSLKKINNKKIINLEKIHYIFLRGFHNNLQEKYNKESLSKLIDYLISLDESIYRKIDYFSLDIILSFISLDSSNYSFIKNKMINNIENSNLYLEKLLLIKPLKNTIKDFFDIYESVPKYMVFSKKNKNYSKLKLFINPYSFHNTKPFIWVNARKAKLYDSFMYVVHIKYGTIDNIFEIITLAQMRILLSDYYDFFKEENRLKNENFDNYKWDTFIDKIWGNLTREVYINILEELINHKNHRLSNEAKIRLDGLYNSLNKRENSYYKEILDNRLLPIISYKGFFDDVYKKIEELKIEIEDNRNNDKASFYRDKELKEQRTEDECRDVLVHRLNDKYKDTIENIREKHEANNRVDINIKSQKNPNWEIQIECKRDDNSKNYIAIKNQLIGKYFSSKVIYGIYLIFYFGYKKDKEKFMAKVEESLPNEYKDNIKIICIDLRNKVSN